MEIQAALLSERARMVSISAGRNKAAIVIMIPVTRARATPAARRLREVLSQAHAARSAKAGAAVIETGVRLSLVSNAVSRPNTTQQTGSASAKAGSLG